MRRAAGISRVATLRQTLGTLAEGALHWAFPDECRHCGTPLGASPTLCSDCWDSIPMWGRLQDATLEGAGQMEARAATRYSGAAREAGFKTIELGSTVPGLPLYEARGYQAFFKEEKRGSNGEIKTIIHMRKAL